MADPQHLFVYGTLRQGDVRWKFLEPFVADTGTPDTAEGALYDTGQQYPAARFDETGTIVGHLYRLRPDRIEEALALMDEVESAVEGLFHRVVIVTSSGIESWAYQYGNGLVLHRITSGDWFRHNGLGRTTG